MGSEASPLRVFISYSHDSPEHADRVLALADRLRQDGLNCLLDQYLLGSPAEGWPRWMERQVRDADFVLMICTPTYYRRVMGEEQPGVGHGVNWEGNLIYQHFYKDGSINTRFLPILLEGGNTSDIPVPFRGVAKYRPMTEEGYDALYRRLTNQPLTPPPDIGTPKKLPPRERPPRAFGNTQTDDTQLVIENVPYARNPFFTGRESLLRQLHELLHRQGSSALSQPQALSGLGGIGKTQTALEYSYRYRHEYFAIFWIRAESEAALNTSYAEIAKRLALPEQEAPDADTIVQAVKHWLEQHEHWLLIFDNADTPAVLKRYVPRHATGKGHLLLTSRAQVFDMLGMARPMEVQELRPEEAVTFLLKRTGRDEPERQERTAAEQLAKELGYLPLALEQSSAYLLEKHARFQDYLASYRKQRLALLNKAQPKAMDYPESVATTWAINFREVEKEPATADILRLSAFLGPDHIPLELLTQGAGHLGPVLSEVLARAADDPLILDEMLEPLTRYSLIHQDVDAQTYSLNRLVQEVVKDTMDEATRQCWAERAVRMVDESFPYNEDAPWPLSQRYLLHALECVTHITQRYMAFDAAAHLLNSVGWYFRKRGQYEDVEPLYQQAQTIIERVEGPDTLNIADILNNLALLYADQGKYKQAEPLYQRALAIREHVLGAEHPDTASSLNNLALLYYTQGKYEQAEPLYQRALAIRERMLGAEHPDTAAGLDNLANLYADQGKYEQAEPLYQRALAIYERMLGAEHPDTARSLNNLAGLYIKQSKYNQAEPLFQRALHILAQALGPDHPDVVHSRNNLTSLYASQSQKSEVQRFFEDAGFRFMGLDEPIGFLGIPATPLWQKKIKHEVYIRILTSKQLDRNDVLRIHDAAQGISKDITLAFAIVDKPVEDHAWLQIAALRADNFSVIPIPFTLFTENRTMDKVIGASTLLEKHMERFLGQGADPYNVRHPIFDVLNFFGREALARDLIERMNSGQSIGLFGLRKMGKSSLMRYMRGLMPCPTTYLDLQAGIELTGLYKRLLHSWNNDAMVRFRTDLNLSDANLGTGDPTTEFVKITQATLDRLASRNPEARLAIFLDEIELIIPPLSATGTTLEHYLSLMRTMRGLVQEDGRILLMVAGVDPAINRISRWGDEQKQNPFFMLLEELYLPPLFESDCIQMIRNIGTQAKLSYSEEAAAYIAQMSGGHPYLARQLCSLAYGQRHQQIGELTRSAMQQAVERFLFDPKYASSINASGLWGEVTNVKLWGEQAARANQDVLFTLAQSTDPIAGSVITNGSDQVALRSALFSLHELSVIHPVEDPLGLGEPYYVISFGLFHSWIRRIRLGLEG